MRKVIISILASLASLALTAQKEETIAIIHGPYLQNVTENEATIVWVTNRSTIGWVETAPDDGSHFYQIERPKFFDGKNGFKNEGRVHSVRLSGLTPGTAYRYRVMGKEVLSHEYNRVLYGRPASTVVYKKEPLKFVTADAFKPTVKFAMVNDIHGHNDVLRSLLGQCELKKKDFVIFLGDMASVFNSEEQVFGDYMDTATELFASETPVFYTRGNHETRGALAYHFQDYFSTKSEHIYYMQRQGPVCFIALDCGEDKPDSDIEYYDANEFDKYRSEQAEWLKQIVQTEEFKSAPFKIVTCHMPPFGGWHGELEVKEKFIPILNEAGVDLMLCGHLHRLEHKNAGEDANFPIIVNSNETLLQGEVTAEKLSIIVTDLSGKKVDELNVRK